MRTAWRRPTPASAGGCTISPRRAPPRPTCCRRAAAAGWAWPPAKTAGSQPYELQPDTGRRGPERLWRRFDAAVSVLTRAAATTDLIAVADAYELLAESVADLADAVEQQDRASGLLPAAARRQSRTA